MTSTAPPDRTVPGDAVARAATPDATPTHRATADNGRDSDDNGRDAGDGTASGTQTASSTAATSDGRERSSGVSEGQPATSERTVGRMTTLRRRYGVDVVVALAYASFALWLTAGMWADPHTRVLAANPEDQTLIEWFLAYDARLVLGDFSFVSDRLNAPDGINMLANATIIVIGVLFAPVTLAFGSDTTFALVAGVNLALTALAWYLLFTRVMRAHPAAALIGGAFCGFAPGMFSQNHSHLHMTPQWLVPVIVWCLVRLLRAAAEPGAGRRVVTSSVLLAAGVSVHVFVGEEVLFLTALTLLLMTIAYAVARPSLTRRAAGRFTGGLLLAGALAALVLAYPLWLQFRGPQSVSNGVFSPDYFSADLASWPAISPMSLAGSADSAKLSTGPSEYNTFLGWPLLIAALGCAIWLLRRPLVIACVTAALAMAAFSLGPTVVLAGERTAIPGPYAILDGLPVVDGALPMRFALAVVPLIATILVLAVDRALREGDRTVRIAVPLAVVSALVPIAPVPMVTEQRAPVPTFITAGHWRDCVPAGGVLVPVPLPTPKNPWSMRWASAVNAEFGLPEGFFIGPYGSRGRGSIGTFKQPTSALLDEVVRTGQVPPVNAGHRNQARRDIDFWQASCFVVADGTANAAALRRTLDALLGPGVRTADVWHWKVR